MSDDFTFDELNDFDDNFLDYLNKNVELDLSSDKYQSMSKHPLYKKLAGIIDRCTNPNNKNFGTWGGKGIQVFEEWNNLKKFPAFYLWAIETGWKEGMELDRINPEKNYEPSNLQWLSKSDHAKKTQNDQRRKDYFSNPDQLEIF
jgi:hypothetical protein